MYAKCLSLLRRVGSFLLFFLELLFGRWNWQQPPWLLILKSKLASLGQLIKAKPLTSVGILIVLCGLMGGSWYAWHWWQNRPQPVRIDFAVTEPERTAIENNAAPQPLLINFNASVAPLDQVGKDIQQGITLKPTIEGRWHWLDDKTLEFKPAKDWSVGQIHQVSFDDSLVAKQIRLARQDFKFTTAKFVASIEKSEFFQDPIDPTIKKAIFQLSFSHPVDAAILETKINLTLNNSAGNTEERQPVKFTVTYDPLKLHAYIHSELLAVPRDNQLAELTLNKDLQAANSEAIYAQALSAKVTIPGKYVGLSITDAQVVVTPNPKTQAQDQVLMLSTSLPVSESVIAGALKVWQLPEFPDDPEVDRSQPYAWSPDSVTDAILTRSQAIEIKALPAEHAFSATHSFLIQADTKRTLWVSIAKGLEAYGGYLLPATYTNTIAVPDYPKALQIMGAGSLLTLSGEKKIALMLRDVKGVKIELGRVLPEQLQHLVSQNDADFSKPDFHSGFGADNLGERFTWDIPQPSLPKGKAHYQSVDLGRYLLDAKGQNKRGIFLLKASDYIPSTTEAAPDSFEQPADEPIEDQRLIVITDLGIIAKTERSGAQVVFVQSIQTGKPQVGAEVEVLGKNGLPLMHATTDSDGKVRFAPLADLQYDREPVLYLVRYQGDMSFLPLGRSDRKLNFTRFEVSGAENPSDTQQLDAYLFSDRGIYRPGDTMHIGVIVKTSAWNTPLIGLPLEAEILDPRGLTIKREKINLAAGGFNELSFPTQESSATGNYLINLYTVKDNKSEQLLGYTKVKVEEFQPDRMKISAKFSKPDTAGWLHPQDLQALIDVHNLTGTPAEARQVTAAITLKPALTAFRKYRDYQFYDPHYAQQSYSDTLTPTITDSAGHAVLSLGLDKYQNATYQLEVTAQAFEAAGGRSVAAEANVLVSDRPFLVGYQADGALNFVAKDAERQLQLIAINPQLEQMTADTLTLEWIERKVLSVLTKQEDSTYRYESRPKEISLRKTAFTIAATGTAIPLDSANAGDYSYIVRDAAGVQVARIDYSVAGVGNVSRTLDRNAELQLSLDKSEYAPGDSITVNIRAPYTGAGLITIERDKVYASTWFKADSQSSVQRITLPKELMGNGYITVQYIRDPGSDEIFMSPLSYGAVPFKVSLAQQRQALTLSVPEQIKPGDSLAIKLQSTEATRAVVFAVDEGILQVARYKNPDPLQHFFQKRQLDVDTSQILDLILPELKKLLQLSAPGGDGSEEEELAASLLNPFKRKHDKPAVFWSGIMDLKQETVVNFPVPETFNGSLRVLAVAVNDQKIASVTQQTQVRGDLIITPNAPFMAAPGDEFTVSVAVANNIKDSGAASPVNLKLSVPPALQVLDNASKALSIEEGHEGVATFRLKVQDAAKVTLGNATLNFVAVSGDKSVSMHSDLSIRPASPRMTSVRLGAFTQTQELAIERLLFNQQRKVSAGISPLPLVAVSALSDYLDNFTHNCTEQLISKAIPAVVLSKYPEFSADPAMQFNENQWLNLLAILRSRQNAEGGFGLWRATPQANDFASVYALHLLLEAKDNGKSVPEDMLKTATSYVQNLAGSPNDTLEGLRARAYAAYLLTRQGKVTTTLLASLRESLHNNFPDETWRQDLTAVYLAGSYQLLQQPDVADDFLKVVLKQSEQPPANQQFQNYYDPLIHDAQTLSMIAKHFPAQLKRLPSGFLQRIAKAVQQNHFNTLSSAYFLMAYQAYSDALPTEALIQLAISAIDYNGKLQALPLPVSVAPRTSFPNNTQSLRFQGPANMPLYYALAETGFDQQLPAQAKQQGLEIQRSYLNAQGQVVDKVKLGEELSVLIRMRAIDHDAVSNLAIQDLLPAGFEVVLQDKKAANNNNADPSLIWQDRLSTGGQWQSEYTDVREDRVLLYGTVSNSMAEYHYKIKAISAGVFTVPPIYAQAMYEPNIQAYSAAGVINVE